MALTKDSVLFYQDFGRGRLDPIVGGAPTFLRAGGAWKFDGRLFRKVIRNQPRFEPVELNDGLRQAGLLLEPGTEQELDDPFDFSTGRWTTQNATRVDADASAVEGKTASKVTPSTTAGFLQQNKGVLSGQDETVVAVVEGVPGSLSTRCQMQLYDSTNNVTEAVTDADLSAEADATDVLFLGRGPNGGPIYIIRATGDGPAGANRTARLFPDRTSNLRPAIVHYVGIEENAYGSNPLDGPANTSQAREALHYAPAFSREEFGGFFEFIAGAPTTFNYSWALHVGTLQGDDPRFLVRWQSSDTLVVLHDDGTDNRVVSLSTPIAVGDHVRLAFQSRALDLDSQVKVGAGSLVTGSAPGGNDFSAGWGGSDPAVRLGGDDTGGQVARVQPIRLFFVKFSDLDSSAGGDLFDELSQFYMTPAGEVV